MSNNNMKYGIELEFFVSKNNKIIPAYLATSNLDGNPFLGEIKTEPFDNIVDCIFELDKLIYLEKQKLEKAGFKMELVSHNQFSQEDLIEFRKNAQAVNKKELEVLEEFSIYPGNKVGKLLKRGEVKASLQINFSKHKSFTYSEFEKIVVEDKYKYNQKSRSVQYACLFNYVSLIQKLDESFIKEIELSKRTKGVYAIKPGTFGDRIEYRSLPNTIDTKRIIEVLK